MHFVSLAAAAMLAAGASAKSCLNMTINIPVTSRNGVFGNLTTPMTNIDATAFGQAASRQGANGTAAALTGYATVSGNYNISVKYCTPATSYSQSGKPLQILTHGIGFDKTYWDLPFNNYNYSYVDAALAKGYSTLSYDRLGIGNSSHGEPKNEIQSFLEIAALAKMTNMVRAGTFPGISQKPSKIVHVGHSFGSAQTYALVNQYPTISDGIVLTGFSMNASFVPLFAAGANFEQAVYNQPLRFGNKAGAYAVNTLLETYSLSNLIAPFDVTTANPLNYPLGYLTNANAGADQYLFFYPPYFDPNILYFSEATKQPVTIGELLTLGSLTMTNAFKGPVLVITGSNDLPYCGGDCYNTGGSAPSVIASVKKNFPSASAFEAYVQPNTGHGINAHYNATGAYAVIQNYLAAHGLGA